VRDWAEYENIDEDDLEVRIYIDIRILL